MCLDDHSRSWYARTLTERGWTIRSIEFSQVATFVRALGLDPLAFNEIRGRIGGTPTVAEIVIRGMDEAHGVIAPFTGDEYAELRPRHPRQHHPGRQRQCGGAARDGATQRR